MKKKKASSQKTVKQYILGKYTRTFLTHQEFNFQNRRFNADFSRFTFLLTFGKA